MALNERKVAVVGCGFVGSASAFALMESGLFSEMVLIDVNREKAEGEALDMHGDSEIAAWSSANVSGIPIHDFCEMRGHFEHEKAMKEIAENVKNSAYEIIEKKGATYYGIAMSVRRICEAIIRDEKSVLPISSIQHGDNGIDGVALSMPAIVGRNGVEGAVPIRLSEQEKDALLKSSETLKAVIDESL